MKVLLLATDAYGGHHGGIALYDRRLAEAPAQMLEVTEVVVVLRVIRIEPLGVPPALAVLSARYLQGHLKTVCLLLSHRLSKYCWLRLCSSVLMLQC